ncbi:MAG: nucleoside-diphosphate sugar epimerase, partial [Deltaproteobacteria bacterium]|nr:nucleoside-diphosphate sugar epimerase [Deltaproteobacteria bacterium]
SKSTIEMISYDDAFGKDFDDMQRRVPGIEKINKLIGFEPKSDLDMILDEVIKYLKN